MYENISFESILKRMLEKIPDNTDKREGSIIYDALAPCAIELQIMYIELDVILKETFGDTASRNFLIRRAAERGIIPYPSTFSVMKGVFLPEIVAIPIGSRFNINGFNYYTSKKLSSGVYEMICEQTGVQGNQNFGTLVPIDYIPGLESVMITELLIPGEDEENTEEIRRRYFESFSTKAYGGNIQDYLNYTNSIPGVGATKVTPVWAGGGTVKLTIVASDFNKASDTLIQSVQVKIDPTKNAEGLGIAPIGHVVTVDTVEEIAIHISTNITYDEGYSFIILRPKIRETISHYLLDLRRNWSSQTNTVVRISQIETVILQIQGVIDIGSTSINAHQENQTLGNFQIPIIGEIMG